MEKYFIRNKLYVFLTIITSMISSLSYVFIAILLQQLLDIVMTKNIEKFISMIIFSLIYFAILGVFLFLQSLFEKKLICKIIYQIRKDTFKGIMSHNIDDFNKSHTTDYMSYITNDIKLIEDNFLLPLFEIIQYTVIFVSSLMIMIHFHLIITICVIIAIVIMFIVPSLIGNSLEKQQNKFSLQLSNFTANLKDTLSGFEIIQSYSLKNYIIYKFNKSNKYTINTKYSVDKLVALNEGLSSFLSLNVQLVVLFLSAYFIITGDITVGTLLGIVQVSSNLANPLLMIFTNLPKIKSVKPIIKKLHNLSAYTKDQCQNINKLTFQKHIKTKDLSFSYDGENEVLQKVTYTIEKGKKYVIIGKSGCGKTTFVKLLSGYYSQYHGNILYDNLELHTLSKDDIVQISSMIHQNIYLFDESIYDNICLHVDYPKEKVDQVIKESGLSDFIVQLPEGLSYQVKENGANLSGGQKQRIAVARALIRDKPLIILDEGTSAIDIQTAYDIENTLLKRKDLTLITITHKMSKDLLKLYDAIIYMEDGKIIKACSFDELNNDSFDFFNHTI